MNTIRRAAGLKPLRYTVYTNFYIAARYGRKEEAKELCMQLQTMGYGTTSSWVDQVEDEMLYTAGTGATGRFAEKDLEEIRNADVLIYLSEDENNVWGRGGRHVEFGYALGIGKQVWIIGPCENLFHYHPGVWQFVTIDDFFAFLAEK